MSKLNRLLHLLAAFLSLGAAFAVFTGVGLPERGDFSGLRAKTVRLRAPEVGALAPPFALPTADFRDALARGSSRNDHHHQFLGDLVPALSA